MDCADGRRLLDAWDSGVAAGASRRARAILREFASHLDEEQIGSLTVGERDCELFTVRHRLFGDRLDAIVSCAQCQQALEVVLDARPFLGKERGARPRSVTVCAGGDILIVAHPPSVGDLESAARAGTSNSAQAIILNRCVESALREGEPIAVDDLPPSALEALGTQLEAVDPDAHVELDACCPGCHESSRYTLDIAAFLWQEIEAEAVRLLHDVHRLARGYGWREADILAMSPIRRRAYVGMLPA